MGQHLLLQNLLRVPKTPLPVETSSRSTVTDEVERNLDQVSL